MNEINEEIMLCDHEAFKRIIDGKPVKLTPENQALANRLQSALEKHSNKIAEKRCFIFR